jgi:nucleotide-binding universal stress UspA family protein
VGPPVALRTILVTSDFSDLAREAYRWAASLARGSGARIVVAHVLEEDLAAAIPVLPGGVQPEVIDLPRFREESRKAAAEALEGVAEEFRREGLAAETAIRPGRPFVEIVRLARELPADLIVMGTHGRSGLRHALIGSVAERVVRKSPCPVLTVKQPGASFESP